MPLYEYQCELCECLFERQLKIAQRDIPLSEPCPICSGIDAIKQVHTKGIGIGDPVRLGHIKPPQDWQRFINRLSRANPGSQFTTY